MESVLLQAALSEQDKRIDPPNHEFLICSIDLLAGVVEGLGKDVKNLVDGSKLIPLVVEICKVRHHQTAPVILF